MGRDVVLALIGAAAVALGLTSGQGSLAALGGALCVAGGGAALWRRSRS